MALDNLPPKSHLEVIEAALQHLLFCHCVPLEGANFKPAQAAVPITKGHDGHQDKSDQSLSGGSGSTGSPPFIAASPGSPTCRQLAQVLSSS
jgi:hypothetical protein